MCKWGTENMVKVLIPEELSHTDKARWAKKGIDSCIAPIVKALQNAGINMTGSCCGHGSHLGSIQLADGRELLILDKQFKYIRLTDVEAVEQNGV